jgi:hypothetical protein
MHIFIHLIIIAIKISLNDADNFKDTCINTAIDTISANIASTSKNVNSDGIKAFRVPSSARGKFTIVPAVTFDACKLLIISNKIRNRQEIKENEERRRK